MKITVGTDAEMENVLNALSGYLETLDNLEVFYSSKRGYLVLRWEELVGKYYGIDSVKDPVELALYIYGELINRITVETKSDHNLKNMNFSDLELEEAKIITRKFISMLPGNIRDRIRNMIDPDSCLLPETGSTVKSLLG